MRCRWWSRPLPDSAALLMMVMMIIALATPARAQFSIPGLPQVVFDPRNLVENARQAAQIAQQIEYQRQALRKLRNPTWRDIDAHVRQVEYLLRQAQALGYSIGTIDREFQRTFPGYEAAATSLDLSTAQRLQAQRTLATMRAGLNVLSAQGQQFQAGRLRLNAIKGQVSRIEGTQEALELQTTLDAFLAEEVGLLRQTIATQANLQAVYNAYQVNQQEQMRANFRAMMDRMSVPPQFRANFSLRLRQ